MSGMGMRRGPLLPRVGLLCAAALFLSSAAAAHAQEPRAFIIKIEGPITEAHAKAVQRRMESAVRRRAETIIFELNTPGGELWSSMDLADEIFSLDDVHTVAYIHDQAYSAGTMIALACKDIYIADKVGMMGDVAPVDIAGNMLGEKQATVVREKLASFARTRGYPEALVKAMVTKEVEVYRVQMRDDPDGVYTYYTGMQFNLLTPEERAAFVSEELIVGGNELLTMHADVAVEYGFARQTVANPQELYALLGLKENEVERIHLTASERALSLLDKFTPMLIVAGFVLMFLELQQPGFGLPGLLGIACFVAFFLIKISLNYAHMLEVLLFAAGLVLLLVEVFITPGFGLLGVSGITLMFISLVLAFQEFGLPRTEAESAFFLMNLLKVTGSFVATLVAIGLLLRYMPSIPLFSRMIHRGDLAAAHVGEIGERLLPGLAKMVGETGIALTPLRPSGRAEFGERVVDVVTEGEFVAKGMRIEILQVTGSRVVVTPYREEETA